MPIKRARWIAAASIGAGALLLAALIVATPWPLLARRAGTVPWTNWVIATLGLGTTYALRAARLRVEWRTTLYKLGLGYRECLHVTLMHNAAVNLLPMRSGEASYAYLLHRRWGLRLGDAAASLLWLRLQDAMVLGVLGLAILPPAPLLLRLAFAVAAMVTAAAVLPPLLQRLHVHARRRRARVGATKGQVMQRKGWRIAVQIIGAFRAARGGWQAWTFAIANWALKLGIIATLLVSLADLSYPSAFAGALGGELAAVLPIQAPAGVGTYEAGVALGIHAITPSRHHGRETAENPQPRHPASTDNKSLIFGAALAVHALIVVVAVATAFTYYLIARPTRTLESST